MHRSAGFTDLLGKTFRQMGAQSGSTYLSRERSRDKGMSVPSATFRSVAILRLLSCYSFGAFSPPLLPGLVRLGQLAYALCPA